MFRYQVFVNGAPQTQFASSIAVAINTAVKQALRWEHIKNAPLSISADRADSLNYGRYELLALRPATEEEKAKRAEWGHTTYRDVDIDGVYFVAIGERRVELLPKIKNQFRVAAHRVLALEQEATRVQVRNYASRRSEGSWKREEEVVAV